MFQSRRCIFLFSQAFFNILGSILYSINISCTLFVRFTPKYFIFLIRLFSSLIVCCWYIEIKYIFNCSNIHINFTIILGVGSCSMGHMAHGILIPQPGIKPRPWEVKVQSPNLWTSRKSPILTIFKCKVQGSSIPGSERSPGEGNGYPLQFSCLGNSMEKCGRLQPMKLKELDTTEATQHCFTYSQIPFAKTFERNLHLRMHIQKGHFFFFFQ